MIFVIAEQRNRKLGNITYEMLAWGKTLAKASGTELNAVVLGKDIAGCCDEIACYVDRILAVDDSALGNFCSEPYLKALFGLIAENRPLITLIGHSSFGMEIAASLAVDLKLPIITDCTDLAFTEKGVIATRQLYGGKVFCRVSFKGDRGIITMRPGAGTPYCEKNCSRGHIVQIPFTYDEQIHKRFIEYVPAPTGDIDIAQADRIIALGRGVRKIEDISTIEEIARLTGAVLACSRPIVDRGWLPRDRQVGSSGKTVLAKWYLAIGISGAYQHIAGMKSCKTIIAVNEDPHAPILSTAHYAIIGDLYDIIPILRDKLSAMGKEEQGTLPADGR